MVSIQNYVNTYIKVMPQRVKIIKQILKRKKKFDVNLDWSVKQGETGGVSAGIKVLKSIIGTDLLFRAAEKRNAQSLRHYVWKYNNSFNYFLSLKRRINKGIAKDPKYAEQVLTIFNDVNAYAVSFAKATKELDDTYIKQVQALDKKDFSGYFELVKSEKKLWETLAEYGRSLKQKQSGFLSFLKFYVRTVKAQEKMKKKSLGYSGSSIFFSLGVAIVFFSFGAFFYYVVYPFSDYKVGSGLGLFYMWATLLPLFIMYRELEPAKILRNFFAHTIN